LLHANISALAELGPQSQWVLLPSVVVSVNVACTLVLL